MPRPPAAPRFIPSSWMPTGGWRTGCGCAAAFLWLSGACTLSSDEFEPALVASERPAPSGGGSAPGAAGGGPACSDDSCLPDAEACDGGSCSGSGAGEAEGGPACAEGRCDADDECSSRRCSDGCCAEPSCSDGAANGSESDVDCGGACAARCGVGERCANIDDCVDGLGCPASLARCTPAACDNRVLDGAEVLVDCGGGACAGCPDGTVCSSAADCASGNCSAGGRCAAACDDGVRNQDERGIDCGGICGGLCPAASACFTHAECLSGVCGAGGCALASDTSCCQAPSCSDGVRNGDESDLDCGSSDPLCLPCGAGLLCQTDTQCASGVCEGGRCCGGSTSDCTRCAERLSPTLDCSSAPPGGSANCAAFLTCLAANASVCSTRFSPGCTNDPGGACNHNTYGGNDGLGVSHAARVLAEAGCTP